MNKINKRVYVLEYGIHVNLYSLNEPNIETRVEYYSRSERDDFIKRYYDLKDKYYINDVKAYFAKLSEIDIDEIVDAI